MFKEDEDVIKETARSAHPAGQTAGGDLFGLWTDAENEPVIHLVTRKLSREKQQSQQPSKSVRRQLRDKFCLPRIGKWLNKRDSEIIRNEIAKTLRVEPGLFKLKTPPKFVLLIMANFSNEYKMELSPYLVSEDAVSPKGTISLLDKANPFRRVDEIGKIIECDSSVKLISREETESEATKINKYEVPPDESGQKEMDSVLENEDVKVPREELGFVRYQANDLKVYMFEEDRQMMEDLVLRYQHVETGGDLFGLWTTEGGAVLHIVLGPGRNCNRTDVSFHQDIPYLQRNGELLTENYMLCHIGEWHSHHQLRLFQPSQGDSSTVIRNYPRDADGFILIIANIVAPNEVMLSPYLYTQKSRNTYDKTGEVVTLPMQNAFKKIVQIGRAIKQGEETEQDAQRAIASRYQNYSTSIGMGYAQPRPRERAYSKGRGNTVEPMEVDDAGPTAKSKRKR